MASALGVNTRRVDLLVFALGSGIAGLAGVGLAMIAPVNPTVGAAYIVNAFLVVIWAVTSPGGFFWPVFPARGLGHRRGDERLGRISAASDHRSRGRTG